MIDKLEAIDRWIVMTINSWHSPVLDEFMWMVSAKLTWVPLYLLLIFLFYRKTDLKKTIVFILCAICVVGLTDLISVHLFKNLIERYRPSHHAELTDRLHFYDLGKGERYKGGMYGFVSSHAANFFGICIYASLVLRAYYKRIPVYLISVALLVSFSRIYLGVHYLTDIIGGAVLGILIAWLIYHFLYKFVSNRYTIKE